MTVLNKKVPSSDGKHILSGKVYLPDGEIKGYFHIVHGMTEHIARYDEFMRSMADSGYICFGYDNLGHGHTVNDDTELGFIAHKNGWKYLVEDVKVFSDSVTADYGDYPYYLMGHSMGSFIARNAAAFCVNPKKLVVMGTGGPRAGSAFGVLLIKLAKLFKGEKHISPLIYKLTFGSYNKRFTEKDPNSWITKDESIRKKYAADPLCNFKFTLSALEDLVKLNMRANSRDWFKTVSGKMPILLVSGGDDPVGNYSKGVKEVYNKLKKYGANADIKIYDNCRHEILNDDCAPQVISDIKHFIQDKK